MKVHVIGGGPAGLYFAILMKKAWPQTRHHGLRAQPAGRHLRLRRRVLRPDARHLRGLRSRELSRDHEPLRLLGRHRDPFQAARVHRIGGNGFCGCSRATLLQILHERAPRARRRAQVPDRRSPTRRRLSATPTWSSPPTASIARPRDLRGPFPADASICGRTSSPGWARPGRSTPSPSSSARPSTASSSPTATSTSRAARPGSSRPTGDLRARRPRQARRGRRPRSFVETLFAEELRATGCSPTARSGAISRPSAASAGSTTTSCCSATPRRPRISRSARAPSSRWRTRSRSTRRSARPAAATSRRRSRLRDAAARRGREDPARRRRVAGLVRARATASGTWTRRGSPSA